MAQSEFTVNIKNFQNRLHALFGKYVIGKVESFPSDEGKYTLVTENRVDMVNIGVGTTKSALVVNNVPALSVACQYDTREPINSKEKKIKFALLHVSLHFFGNQERFCRSEWAIEVDESDNELLIHPQPHWHFDMKEKPKNTDFITSQNEMNVVNQFMATSKNDKKSEVMSDRLHFAMYGDWNQQKFWEERRPVDEKEILNWIEMCLVNVIDEYNDAIDRANFKSCCANRETRVDETQYKNAKMRKKK